MMKWSGRTLTINRCANAEITRIPFSSGGSSSNDYPGKLRTYFGSVKIRHNTFSPQIGSYLDAPVLIAQSSGSSIDNNVFLGALGGAPGVYQSQGYASYSFNEFLDSKTPSFKNNYGTVEMYKGSKNTFIAAADGMQNPHIYGNGGSLNLYCGYNRFVNSYADPDDFPLIEILNNTNGQSDWRKNYWGTTTATGLLCEEVNDYIPDWADASNCLGEYNPPIYFCPQTDDEPEELWLAGQEAEEKDLFDDAIWYYSEVVRLYPSSTQAPKASERLKEIGKMDASYVESTKSALLVACQISASQSDTWLASTQFSSAQCIEAVEGDREIALLALDSLVATGSQIESDIASLALLEIATYPPQGSMSAVSGTAAILQMKAQQAALESLVSLVDATETPEIEGGNVPSSFGIQRIFPNPFNPRTTIVLNVVQDGHVRVIAFNMLGQVAQTLIDAELRVGQHSIEFDGTSLSTGLYIVRAEMGRAVSTEKVLLMK